MEKEPVSGNKEERRGEILANLRLVGPNQPLGYARIVELEDLGESPEYLAEEARAKGLKVLYSGGQEGELFTLLTYDEEELQKLIMKNIGVLVEAHWPTIPEYFASSAVSYRVGRPFNHGIREKTKLFDVIADAFGEYYHPGRLAPGHPQVTPQE